MSATSPGMRALAPAPSEATPYDPERATLLWRLARHAVRLACLDPGGLGGVVLYGRHGPSRSALLEELGRYGPVRRVPPDVDVEALLGGLDTAATLAGGRTVRRAGLLEAGADTALLLAGGERLQSGAANTLAAWLERDGEPRAPLIVLDESLAESPLTSSALGERLALHVAVPELSLAALERAVADDPAPSVPSIALSAPLPAPSSTPPAAIALPDDILEELVRMAARLDVPSARSAVQVCRTSRAAARLAGREAVTPADAALAVQLVLAPRARRVPDEEASAEGEPAPEETSPDPADAPADPAPQERTPAPDEAPPDETAEGMPEPPPAADEAHDPAAANEAPAAAADALPERLIEAAVAALPRNLLDELVAGRGARDAAAGRDAGASAGEDRAGRPIGVRRPRGDGRGRLNLPATLKAAIPWQRLRDARPANDGPAAETAPSPRLRVRREDFRVTRYRQPTRTTTVFVVDASGSAAMHRLAEAKGAVESLLAECYVRRDRVSLITFRGTEATLDLSPTRSLVRARRALVGLPGGGGTPLAAGLELAADVLERLIKGGESPVGVFMTDARGNIARDGTPSREAARHDAERSAARLAALGVRLLFVDTAPRPRPDARHLAASMRARYLALPQLDPALLGGAPSAAAGGGSGAGSGRGRRR